MNSNNVNTEKSDENRDQAIEYMLTPEFEAWMEAWESWLTACLCSGIDQIGSATETLVADWQQSASTLGFGDYAELSKTLFSDAPKETRISAFKRCLLAFQTLQQLIKIQTLK